jgi:hypothetical protein
MSLNVLTGYSSDDYTAFSSSDVRCSSGTETYVEGIFSGKCQTKGSSVGYDV